MAGNLKIIFVLPVVSEMEKLSLYKLIVSCNLPTLI